MEKWTHRIILMKNFYNNGDSHILMIISDNFQYPLGTGTPKDLKERVFRRFGLVRWYKKDGLVQTKKFKF